MITKLTGFIGSHKKLSIATCVIILVLLLAIIRLFGGSSWAGGGEDTSASFRYRVKSKNTIELRVSTENLSADGFTILTDDSEQLQSVAKGEKGTEAVYLIAVDSDASYATWTLAYYQSEDAKAADQRAYTLTVTISRNDDGSRTVTAAAGEAAQSSAVTTDDYELNYQLTGDTAAIEITKPENIIWQTEYDEAVVSVDDLFTSDGVTTAAIRSVTDQDWETTVIFYDYYVGADGTEVRDPEIKLHITCSEGEISEITNEE